MKNKQHDPRKGKEKARDPRISELIDQLRELHPSRTDNIIAKAAKTKASGERNPTRHEAMFRNALNKYDCEYEFQCLFMNSYSYYCTDFYLTEEDRVVEIDGSYHETPISAFNDSKRTKVLINENGVRSVIRFTNKEVEEDADTCARIALGIIEDNRYMDDIIDFNNTSICRSGIYRFFPSEYSALIKDDVALNEIVRRYSSNIVLKHRRALEDVGINGYQLKKAAYLTSLAAAKDICTFNVIDEMMHVGVRNFFERVYKCIFDDCKHILKDEIKDEDVLKPVTGVKIDRVDPILGKASKNEFNNVLTKAIKVHSKPRIKNPYKTNIK